MLGHPQLPPGLIEHCMNVLKKIMPSQRDLIRVIVEIIVELREAEDDAENADDPQALVGSCCIPILPRYIYILTDVSFSSTTTNRTFQWLPSGRTSLHARPKNDKK